MYEVMSSLPLITTIPTPKPDTMKTMMTLYCTDSRYALTYYSSKKEVVVNENIKCDNGSDISLALGNLNFQPIRCLLTLVVVQVLHRIVYRRYRFKPS
jgi:hypothetical protein